MTRPLMTLLLPSLQLYFLITYIFHLIVKQLFKCPIVFWASFVKTSFYFVVFYKANPTLAGRRLVRPESSDVRMSGIRTAGALELAAAGK